MNAEEINEKLREMPPGAFTIYIDERTPIEVLHADFAMLSPSGRTLTVYDTERRMHHVNSDSITRISHAMPAERADG